MRTFKIETKVDMITIVIIESTKHETLLDEVARTLKQMERDPQHDYVTTLTHVDEESR